jgi:hypothetical protein
MVRDDTAYSVNLKDLLRPIDQKATKKPLLDLRLYFTYDIPGRLNYLLSLADSVLTFLRTENFLCPGYTHIYISVGQNRRDAIEDAFEIEKWFRYGISVLPKEKLLKADEFAKEHLIIKAISDGLLDLAERDKLDKSKIKAAIAYAKEGGIFQETIINGGENSKYKFRISSLPVKGKSSSDIYFSLFDKIERKEYKWKFGRLYSLEASWWFFNITVTNKEIRTKPKANMELVLKGKKNCLKISVEKIKSGKGRITISETKVAVPAWLVKLDDSFKAAKKRK